MHDPDVLALEIAVPIPVRSWSPAKTPAWGVARRRFTGPADHPLTGTPIEPWWQPRAWSVRVASHSLRWWRVIEIWHSEPGGRDAGKVCGYPPDSELGLTSVVWACRHRAHLRMTVLPYQRVKRWLFDRCDDCGKRFLWKQNRNGYQSSDAVYHDACMSLRHVRGQLDDLTSDVRFDADETTRWRVEYRLRSIGASAGEGEA